MDVLTGIILGAIFGSLFLLTCIISAVKAVRDRKRIKARIAQREREKRANGTLPETGIEDKEIRNNSEVLIDHTTEKNHAVNGHLAPEMQFPSSKTKSEDANSSYSSNSGIDNLTHHGVDNLTFERSFVDIPLADESQGENSENNHSESKLNPAFQSTCEITPVVFQVEKETKPYAVSKTASNEKRELKFRVNENGHDKMKKHASSDDKDAKLQVDMKHLSPECLAVKKLLRRHSYEVAISDYTWLPNGQPPPSYASAVKNGDKCQSKQTQKKFSLVCENKAYDKDDHKRNSAF